MQEEKISLIRSGLETAYINGNVASELSYKPNFVSNNYNEGKKVLSVIEDELLKCDKFQISVKLDTFQKFILDYRKNFLTFIVII